LRVARCALRETLEKSDGLCLSIVAPRKQSGWLQDDDAFAACRVFGCTDCSRKPMRTTGIG